MTESDKDIRIALWPTVALFVGLGLCYIGERAVSQEKVRYLVDGVAGLTLLGGLIGRGLMWKGATDDNHRRAESWLLIAYGVVLLGLLEYLGVSEGKNALRESLGKGYERVEAMSAMLWPALLLGGVLTTLFMQLSLQSMTDGFGTAEHVELRRVRYSAAGGLTVALVVIFVFSINYVAAERNTKWDLARFRSTRPSEATRKIVENLGRTVRATIFLPSANEVREQIAPYFEDLKSRSPRFEVEIIDHALEPQKAKELSATGNGLVVLGLVDEKDKTKVSQRELVHVGTTLENAGSALQTFDGDVQKRLLVLTRPGRVAYFTVGHGERNFDRFSGLDQNKEDLRAPVGGLQQLLQGQGYEVKTLGIGQGLAKSVPKDAGIVFLTGPTEHFLAEEVTAIKDYLQGGGHVFLMLDPTSETAATDLAPLLDVAGIKYHPQLLANKEVHWVRTHQPSDVVNLGVLSFSSHASINTLSRASGRAAVVMPKTGWLERGAAAPAGIALDFTMRTPPGTWVETNNNFTKDKDEKEQVFEVAAAASRTVDAKEKKELRMTVLGSVDAASDLVLGNRANLVFVLDSVKWLMGDEAITGEMPTETDQPIVHTKGEDKTWFYLTVFVVPAMILAVGYFFTRQTRRRRSS